MKENEYMDDGQITPPREVIILDAGHDGMTAFGTIAVIEPSGGISISEFGCTGNHDVHLSFVQVERLMLAYRRPINEMRAREANLLTPDVEREDQIRAQFGDGEPQ